MSTYFQSVFLSEIFSEEKRNFREKIVRNLSDTTVIADYFRALCLRRKRKNTLLYPYNKDLLKQFKSRSFKAFLFHGEFSPRNVDRLPAVESSLREN